MKYILFLKSSMYGVTDLAWPLIIFFVGLSNNRFSLGHQSPTFMFISIHEHEC
jgi:hypothetical protein